MAGKLKVKQTTFRRVDGTSTHDSFGLSMAFKDFRNLLVISHDDV